MTNEGIGALDGVRVLDCGTFVAGTFSASLMGDLGADVIKVEPLAGDPAREIGPHFNGESRFFISVNRNKRGIAIDLTTDTGQQTLHRLVKDADVVTTNFRPGIAAKLKLDYETLSAVNPRIIYSESTGFGSSGPLAKRPAFDGILQSMSGIAVGNGRLTGKSMHSSVLMCDFTTSVLALSAILAALHHRNSSGVGQQVETSLLQSSIMLQPYTYTRPLETEPEGPSGSYPYRVFETKNGHVFVGSAQNKFWPLLCRAIGLPDLADDAELSHLGGRMARANELTPQLEEQFKTRNSEEWEQILADTGVPCGPVLSAEEFFGHPQVEAMDQNPIVEHPTIGKLHVPGLPFHLGRTPSSIDRAAPTLGQHTDEVLAESGFDSGQIYELRQNGVIR